MAPLKQQDRIALEIYESCSRRAAAEPRRYYLGMSRIGDPCERRLWLDYRIADKAALEGRTFRIFDNGEAAEARIITDLWAAGYTIDREQEEFSDFDDRFRGHCDGVIHGVTQRPHLLEIKTANAANFKIFQQKGLKEAKPIYFDQMQCYMGYGQLERGLFVVENKNTQELYTERIYFDRFRFEELKDKAQKITEATEAPPKPEDADCYWCDFRDYGCLNPPTGGPGCPGCAWWRSADKITAGSIEIILTLRDIRKMLQAATQEELAEAKDLMVQLLKTAYEARPDLSLPYKFFNPQGDLLQHFWDVQAYVLTTANGWVNYSGDPSKGKGNLRPEPAAGPWCVHPNHRQRIYQPIGCQDWAPEQPPF